MTSEEGIIFTGLLLISVLVLWSRIGSLRESLGKIQTLLLQSQGVVLANEVTALRRGHEELHSRIRSIEDHHSANRRELIDTNAKVLAAMNALREDWQAQQAEMANRVVAEVLRQVDMQARRVARDEYHKLASGAAAPGA